MGLLGGHQDGGEAQAAAAEGMSATADRENVHIGGDKEGERQYQLPGEDSGSNSESGAETDDEASSTSDYPPHLGQGMAVVSTIDSTRSQGYSCGSGMEKAVTVASQHQDVAKESSTLETTSAQASSLPTVQLPQQQPAVVDSDNESSNGGNEPDISCSASEGGGGGNDLPQDQSEMLQLRLPSGATRHGSDHNSESESESESSSVESVQDELEDLSLMNKLRQPHRDRVDDHQKDADSASVATTTASTTTNSYLYGENASDHVRHLVKRSISKKKKQQQRQSRPKKETKAPTPAGRRSKKTNRNVVKNSMDVTIY